MTTLELPDVRWHASWAASMLEFGDEYPHGSGLGDPFPTYDEPGCAAFADTLRAAERTPIRAGWVPCSFFWIVADAQVIGSLALRHSLNAWLLEEGGHIGFSIRPSQRRRGHAARALAASLPRAAERGLERVLVTCEEVNLGSRRTIEGEGGVYEDTRNGKRRYWIETGAAAQAPGR